MQNNLIKTAGMTTYPVHWPRKNSHAVGLRCTPAEIKKTAEKSPILVSQEIPLFFRPKSAKKSPADKLITSSVSNAIGWKCYYFCEQIGSIKFIKKQIKVVLSPTFGFAFDAVAKLFGRNKRSPTSVSEYEYRLYWLLQLTYSAFARSSTCSKYPQIQGKTGEPYYLLA